MNSGMKGASRATVTEIFETHFPERGSAREKLAFALEYAVMAPSVRNTQPWLFDLRGDALDVHADMSRKLKSVDARHRDIIISCGAAVENICVTLRYYGQSPTVTPFPDGTESVLIARIQIDGPHVRTAGDEEEFLSIRRRHTNRMPFSERALPLGFQELASAVMNRHGVGFKPVFNGGRRFLANMVAEAEIFLWEQPEYRREVAAWFGDSSSRKEDGMAPAVRGVSSAMAIMERWMMNSTAFGHRMARRNTQLAAGAPLLAVVHTQDDSHRHWLSTGRALGQLLLRARAAGLLASFFSQPIHHAPSRDQLAQLHADGGHPHIVLAFGYAGHGKHPPRTPRRALSKMVAPETDNAAHRQTSTRGGGWKSETEYVL